MKSLRLILGITLVPLATCSPGSLNVVVPPVQSALATVVLAVLRAAFRMQLLHLELSPIGREWFAAVRAVHGFLLKSMTNGDGERWLLAKKPAKMLVLMINPREDAAAPFRMAGVVVDQLNDVVGSAPDGSMSAVCSRQLAQHRSGIVKVGQGSSPSSIRRSRRLFRFG